MSVEEQSQQTPQNAKPPLRWAQLNQEHCKEFLSGILTWQDPVSILLRDLDLDRGVFHAYLPGDDQVPCKKGSDLDWETPGMVGRIGELSDCAYRFVLSHLGRSPRHLALVSTHYPPDPRWDKPEEFIGWIYGHDGPESQAPEIYLHLNRTATLDEVNRAFRSGRGFTNLVVLGETDIPLTDRGVLTLEQEQQIAESCSSLVFDAFDGFGYIYWTRSGRNEGHG